MNARPAAYSTAETLRKPTPQPSVDLLGLFSVLLVFLLPPIGLLLLWRQGMFQTRGRVFLTTLSTIEMTLLLVLLTPHAELSQSLPLPVAPVAVTVAPETDNLKALYNIEELLYEKQLAQVVAQGGTAEDLLTEEQKLEQQKEDRETILNTIVYAVFNNAKLYHAQMVCGTQSNGRQLTVQEAMMEALGPCPDCNPPVWVD